MEKKTNSLCIEVLNRLDKAGILQDLIVISSWSIYFYQHYFNSKNYSTFIRTTDIDFLVPILPRFRKEVNVFELIKDLGFLETYKGSKGYIKLVHSDLTVEFLVLERGRGANKPYFIPQLSINADGLRIKLPHPAAYALHKFIIFKRRNAPKMAKSYPIQS